MIGGGTLPEESLPSRVLAIAGTVKVSIEEVAARLRRGSPSVVGRVEHDRLLLDPRTVQPAEDALLIAALKQALA
jgi:L-seryl-tRNA(Ser) seleniumtransferase